MYITSIMFIDGKLIEQKKKIYIKRGNAKVKLSF